MNIQFRQGSEILSQKLIDRAERDIRKLDRYLAERNFQAFVRVDVERESSANNSESRWRASINLDAAGTRLNASAVGNTQDKAVSRTIKELKYEMQKSSTKPVALKRRSAGFFKQLQQQFG